MNGLDGQQARCWRRCSRTINWQLSGADLPAMEAPNAAPGARRSFACLLCFSQPSVYEPSAHDQGRCCWSRRGLIARFLGADGGLEGGRLRAMQASQAVAAGPSSVFRCMQLQGLSLAGRGVNPSGPPPYGPALTHAGNLKMVPVKVLAHSDSGYPTCQSAIAAGERPLRTASAAWLRARGAGRAGATLCPPGCICHILSHAHAWGLPRLQATPAP